MPKGIMKMNEICQSCGMIMNSNEHGTNADGTVNADYCRYCYQEGRFGKDETMEEMIESCIPFRINDTDCPDAESARNKMMKTFPVLKRWAN